MILMIVVFRSDARAAAAFVDEPDPSTLSNYKQCE
jgi:hypothetical protein